MEGGKHRFEKNVDIIFGLLTPLSGDGDSPSFVNTSFFICSLEQRISNSVSLRADQSKYHHVRTNLPTAILEI